MHTGSGNFLHIIPNLISNFYFSLLYCMPTSLCHKGAGLGTLGLTEPVMRQLCTDAGFTEVRRVDIRPSMNVIWEVRPRL
jgi:hypothetical protein